MKSKYLKMGLVMSVMVVFAACGGKTMTGKPGSSGKTLELMIVSPNSLFSGSTHNVLDSLFAVPQDGLNQPESRFIRG